MGEAIGIRQVTFDYSIFRRSKGNRPLNRERHKALRDSMLEYGFFPWNDIWVYGPGPGEYEIFDGQHRLAIAEELQLGVWYTVIGLEPPPIHVARLNSTQVPWVKDDHISTFIAEGRQDYIELRLFAKEYGLNEPTAAALLQGTTTNARVRKAIENGTYKITKPEFAREVARFYRRAAEIKPFLAKAKDRFLHACLATFKLPLVGCREFDHERFLRNLARYPFDPGEKFVIRDHFHDMIAKVYNRGCSKSDKIPGLKDYLDLAAKARDSAARDSADRGPVTAPPVENYGDWLRDRGFVLANGKV